MFQCFLCFINYRKCILWLCSPVSLNNCILFLLFPTSGFKSFNAFKITHQLALWMCFKSYMFFKFNRYSFLSLLKFYLCSDILFLAIVFIHVECYHSRFDNTPQVKILVSSLSSRVCGSMNGQVRLTLIVLLKDLILKNDGAPLSFVKHFGYCTVLAQRVIKMVSFVFLYQDGSFSESD